MRNTAELLHNWENSRALLLEMIGNLSRFLQVNQNFCFFIVAG